MSQQRVDFDFFGNVYFEFTLQDKEQEVTCSIYEYHDYKTADDPSAHYLRQHEALLSAFKIETNWITKNILQIRCTAHRPMKVTISRPQSWRGSPKFQQYFQSLKVKPFEVTANPQQYFKTF